MRVLKSGGRLAVAVVVIVAGASLGGCVTSSGPDVEKPATVYWGCLQETGVESDGFSKTVVSGRPVTFDSFKTKREMTDEQEAAMRACYDARLAKM